MFLLNQTDIALNMPALHLIVRVLSINVTRGNTPNTSNLFQFVSSDAAPMEQPIVHACSGLILRLPERIAATYHPFGTEQEGKRTGNDREKEKGEAKEQEEGKVQDVQVVCYPQERCFDEHSRWAPKIDWASAVAYEHIEGRLCSGTHAPYTPLHSFTYIWNFSYVTLSVFLWWRVDGSNRPLA